MTKAKKKVNLPAEEGENSTLKKTPTICISDLPMHLNRRKILFPQTKTI